jgi:DNA-binding HxlR family transcriptional regulator
MPSQTVVADYGSGKWDLGMSVLLAGQLAQRGDVAMGDRCPLDRTVQLVGNRTALVLLRVVFYGTSRFDSLVKRVGVTEAAASQRLRELVEVGVLVKEPYRDPGQRTRFAYALTDSGHDLLPVVLALIQWGAAHTRGGAPTVTHTGCGERVLVEVRCAAGHAVREEDVAVGW